MSLTALSVTVLPSTAAVTPPAAATSSSVVCNHADPTTISADSARLSQPTSSTDSRPLGQAIGEGVAAAMRSIETLDATGRPTSGLPYGLSQGIVGVLGTATTGYKVIVDDSVVDEEKYQAAVAKNVPAAGMKMLKVERSCRSARAIAAAWNEVGARSWTDAAGD